MPERPPDVPKEAYWTGRTWVIYTGELGPANEFVDPADLVAQFNGVRETQLGELDDMIMAYYAQQERKLGLAEARVRTTLNETFVGKAKWKGGRLDSEAAKVDKMRRGVRRELRRWQSATEQEFLGALAKDKFLTDGMAPGTVDQLIKAVNSKAKSDFMELANFAPDKTELWKERQRIIRDLPVQGIEKWTEGRYSNVLAFIENETRRVRETVDLYSSYDAPRRDATNWVEQVQFNRNTFKLSETAHGLGLYRWSTKVIYQPADYLYRLDVPPSFLPSVSPNGAVAGGLHRILSAAQWEAYNRSLMQAAGKKSAQTGTAGLGFHHGDRSVLTPIPVADDAVLEAFEEDARAKRKKFLADQKMKKKADEN